MQRTTFFTALATTASLATAGTAAYAQANKHNTAHGTAYEVQQAKISLEQAIATAQAQHAGSKVVKAELDSNKRGQVYYEVKVVSPNQQVHEVKIDAVTGKILSNRIDD